MIEVGDIVRSQDERDDPSIDLYVLEVGIRHVSGEAAKVTPNDWRAPAVYRLVRNLEPVDMDEGRA